MYYVYIIYSAKYNKIYKGLSLNIKQRIKEHNYGNVESTKHGRPWKLIYCEIFINKKDAQSEEKFLKTGKGRERIKYLLQETLKKQIKKESMSFG